MNKRQTLAVTSTSMLAAGMAQGAVVYTGVNTQLIPDEQEVYTYPFDLDGDGWIDFQAAFHNHNENKPYVECRSGDLPQGISNTNGWTLSSTNFDAGNADYWGAPVTPFGTAIDAGYAASNPPAKTAYLYQDYDGNTLGDWPINGLTDGYVGLAIIDGSTTNYGYIHLILDGTASPKTLTVVGYGYESTPGVGIVAGAQVTPAEPVIYTPPVSQEVGAGSPVQMHVQALADPAPTYQWQAGAVGSGIYTNLIDDGHFAGVNTDTLSIDAATIADNLDIQVVVSNGLGSANSSPPATLTVTGAVLDGPFPSDAHIFLGQDLQFDIQVLSGTPTSYQWRKGGANLSDGDKYFGTATSSLIISNLSGADDGGYDVVVGGTGGATTSPAATLTTVLTNGGAFEGATLANRPSIYYRLNETEDTFTGDVIAYDNGGGKNGVYGMSVQNGGPSYSVAGPRPADGFPGFHSTNYAVRTIKNDNNGAIKLVPWNLNTNTVTISAWIKPENLPTGGDGIVMVRNTGTGNVCGMAYYTGNAALGYNWHDELGTWAWDSGVHPPLDEWSFVALVVTPTNATIYLFNNDQVTMSVHDQAHVAQFTDGPGDNSVYIGGNTVSTTGGNNFEGVIDEVAAFKRPLSQQELFDMYLKARGIAGLPPTITEQPRSERLFAGWTTHFSVTASGSEPLTYTWMAGTSGVYTNLVEGGDVQGVSSDSLTIANVSADDVMDYQVVITNAAGAVTSSVVSLSLAMPSGTPYETSVLSLPGLTAYYPLDELEDPATNALAFDPVGGFTGLYGTTVQNGNPIYGVVGPRPVDGFSGFSSDNTAALFGTIADSQITLPALNLNTNAVTITGWIKPTSNPNPYAGIVFCRGGSGMVAGLNYSGQTNSLGERTLGYHWNDAFDTYTWDSGLVPPLNEWSFVALSMDPTTATATLWLINANGTSSASNQTTNNLAFQSFDAPTMIGRDALEVSADNFSGYIDNVAICAGTLSPSQIQGLYSVAATGETPVAIDIQRVGAQVQLTWPRGTLLEATNLAGPWMTNMNASPYLVTPGDPQKYFRVQVQ